VKPFSPAVNLVIGMSLLATDNDGPGDWGQIMWSGDGDNQANWADMKFSILNKPVDPLDPNYPTIPTDTTHKPNYVQVDKQNVEVLLQLAQYQHQAQLKAVSQIIQVHTATSTELVKLTFNLDEIGESSYPIFLYKIG